MIVRGQAAITSPLSDEATAQLQLRYRLACAAADGHAAAGFTVILQDIVLGEDLRRYADSIRTRPKHVVVLAPDPAEVARREAGRSKTGYGDDWTPAQLDRSLREETPRLGLWLDTSAHTPSQTTAAILERLDEARV
jgi:hypothetical protein